MADLYVIAGADLRQFTADWLSDLQSGEGMTWRGLLDHAKSDPIASERYEYGADYVLANIAPHATKPEASDHELLLFAVMVTYKRAGYPGADPTFWDGEEAHVGRAFAYFQEVGEHEAARQLRHDVIRRSRPDPDPWIANMLRQRALANPARAAAHEQDMTSIHSRSLRAAALLDPDGDFDSELTAAT